MLSSYTVEYNDDRLNVLVVVILIIVYTYIILAEWWMA